MPGWLPTPSSTSSVATLNPGQRLTTLAGVFSCASPDASMASNGPGWPCGARSALQASYGPSGRLIRAPWGKKPAGFLRLHIPQHQVYHQRLVRMVNISAQRGHFFFRCAPRAHLTCLIARRRRAERSYRRTVVVSHLLWSC